jgi:hypothetical protein
MILGQEQQAEAVAVLLVIQALVTRQVGLQVLLDKVMLAVMVLVATSQQIMAIQGVAAEQALLELTPH